MKSTRPQLCISVLVVGLLCLGCHEQRFGTRPAPAEGEELPILEQYQGTHSHETRAMQLVVRDTQSLAQVPLIDMPVNFNDEMLLIVTLGQVTSDQHAVRIDRVWREAGRLRVSVQMQTPSTTPTVTMSSPYCVAVVPRCDLNVADFLTTPPKRERSWDQSPPPAGLNKGEKPAKAPNLNRDKRR
ncbi:MAG: hypothetical protein AABZ08_04910 [Planctomycetota bacterium]